VTIQAKVDQNSALDLYFPGFFHFGKTQKMGAYGVHFDENIEHFIKIHRYKINALLLIDRSRLQHHG
jgi:hypothetical protein